MSGKLDKYLTFSGHGSAHNSSTKLNERHIVGRSYSIFTLIYIVFGIVIAFNNGYFVRLDSISTLLSAFLAIILWPLILFGVNLHLVF